MTGMPRRADSSLTPAARSPELHRPSASGGSVAPAFQQDVQDIHSTHWVLPSPLVPNRPGAPHDNRHHRREGSDERPYRSRAVLGARAVRARRNPRAA